MGNQCSCAQDSHDPFKESVVEVQEKPKITFNTTQHLVAATRASETPLIHLEPKCTEEIEVFIEDPSPAFMLDSKPVKLLSRIQSYDNDRGSQNEETSAPLSKKGVSFFHLNSIENNANPIEFTSQTHGNEWKLQNIKLGNLIQKTQSKYLWEATNTSNQKKCTVKVSLVETARLLHCNLSKAEWVLRELNTIKSHYVAEIHSFSIWEADFQAKPHFVIVIVQELTRCSLRDVQNMKAEEGKTWTQTQVLTILHDIYSGLMACKEKHITHGKLVLENVLISETMDKVKIANFDIKLPVQGELKILSSPGKSLFSKYGNSELNSPELEKLATPPSTVDTDLHDLTVLILKLVTMDENVGFEYESLKKDDRYKRAYHKVFEELDIIVKRIRPVAQIIKDLQKHVVEGEKRLDLDYAVNLLSTKRQGHEAHVDTLFTKIDCYELINQHEAALEVYGELIKILKSKNTKGPKECIEYVRCVNRTIKHYLTMNNWLKAKDVSSELSNLLKQDETLKKVIKAQPKEYICFIFLLASIYEGMNEPERAINLYSKGLAHCVRTSMDPEMYASALRKISNLHIKRNEDSQAFEYLKKLVAFYETQDGYYNDKANAYLNMGDIIYKQGHPGQSVKMYLKSFENLKKRKSNNDALLLEVLRKIVENFESLCEDENVLIYMKNSQELKKTLYGNDSQEYMEEIKKTGEIQMRMKNFQGALESYLKYHKLCSHNEIMREQYADSMIHLGDVYAKVKRYEKATEYYEKYSEIQENAKGQESREYLTAQDRLANMAFKQKQFKKAIEIQEQSFAIKDKLFEPNDRYFLISVSNLGDSYFANGEYKWALKLHKECLEALLPRQNEFKSECSQLLLKIAYDYEKAGEGGLALESVHKSFNGFGTDTEKTIELYEMLGKLKETKVDDLDFSRLKTRLDECKTI